ncbi:hypothetical protein [Leucobacter japonicus]|uniref:hypothetical protein n=1 Tax=Leucobacter japonicus TaxID=1461259 RepID=UPI0006A7B87D|nr:hypothetical protein [Leucobacter japonicus]
MTTPSRRERVIARFTQPRKASEGEPRPIVERSIDRLLAVQRPPVLAHLRRIRKKYPQATPDQIVRVLEVRYLATVTAGGAGVGAAAVIPSVGTGIALGLASAETIGFVEATALFAHSVAEVHGVTTTDRERTRALVLALMLGQEGADLVRQVTMQAVGGGGSRRDYWGKMLTSALPRYAVGPLLDRLKTSFFHRLAGVGGASVIGKVLPFGIGAVVGGTGNHLLARRVVRAARDAFGPAPFTLPSDLEPVRGRLAPPAPVAFESVADNARETTGAAALTPAAANGVIDITSLPPRQQ